MGNCLRRWELTSWASEDLMPPPPDLDGESSMPPSLDLEDEYPVERASSSPPDPPIPPLPDIPPIPPLPDILPEKCLPLPPPQSMTRNSAQREILWQESTPSSSSEFLITRDSPPRAPRWMPDRAVRSSVADGYCYESDDASRKVEMFSKDHALVMSDDPSQTSVMSGDTAQTSVISDDDVKTSVMSDDPFKTSVISGDPAQTSVMSDDPVKTSGMADDSSQGSVMSDDPDTSLDHDLQWVTRIVKKRDMKTFETFEKSPSVDMSFARILQIVAVCGSPEMVECMAKWQENEWDTDCEICELLLVEELKGLEVKTATALYLAAFLDKTEMVCSLVTYSSENNMGFCFRTLKLSEPTEKVFMMDLAEKIKLKHSDIQPATVIPGHRMDKCRGRTRVYIVYSVLVVKASTYELEDLGHVMLVNPYKITQEVDDDARERMSVSNEETNRAQKALSKHRQKLWTEHSNLNIIRVARFKHQNHVTGITEKTYIELYCSTKGVVPLGEQEFPKRLDVGNSDFIDVNVREGYFRYGAYDTLPSSSHHPTLKMGCNVGRSTPEYDQGNLLQSVSGTLGPFVRYDSKIGFLSCAHVFFNITNPAQPLDYHFNGRDKIEVVQPSLDTPGNQGIPIPCGYVHRAIFNPQLDPSVDVTVVELMNRIPNHGRFANNSRNSYKKAGFDELPEFNTGLLKTNVRGIAPFQTVFKFGSVSDVTRGVLDVSGCDVRPLSTILGLPRKTGAAHMINQYQVFGIYPSLSFFLEGDSGSAVFMKDPVKRELVCIGMAIGHTNVDIDKFPSTVVTPIGAILKALGSEYKLASFP